MRQKLDMEELLASVSEEETLEAQRGAAVAGVDSAEVRRLDRLIVENMKREVEAEGGGDGVGAQNVRVNNSGPSWLSKACYFVSLGTILSLLLFSPGPEVTSASAAAWTNTDHPVTVTSDAAGLALADVSATAITQPSCESVTRPEKPQRVGDLIGGGYWTHLQGVSWVYQVTSIERRKSIQWSKWGYESAAMGEWLIVQVRLKNAGRHEGMPYPYDFQVMDREGAMYPLNRSISHLYSDYKQLYTFSATVPPGVWAEVGVVTDIAPDARGLKLCILQAGTVVDLGE